MNSSLAGQFRALRCARAPPPLVPTSNLTSPPRYRPLFTVKVVNTQLGADYLNIFGLQVRGRTVGLFYHHQKRSCHRSSPHSSPFPRFAFSVFTAHTFDNRRGSSGYVCIGPQPCPSVARSPVAAVPCRSALARRMASLWPTERTPMSARSSRVRRPSALPSM